MTREEAIDLLGCIYMEVSTDADKEAVDMAIEALKEQRPRGRWIFNKDGNYECSECRIAWKDMPAKDAKPVFKACPWCGADMRKESDGE